MASLPVDCLPTPCFVVVLFQTTFRSRAQLRRLGAAEAIGLEKSLGAAGSHPIADPSSVFRRPLPSVVSSAIGNGRRARYWQQQAKVWRDATSPWRGAKRLRRRNVRKRSPASDAADHSDHENLERTNDDLRP